jgi:hypothetical protein
VNWLRLIIALLVVVGVHGAKIGIGILIPRRFPVIHGLQFSPLDPGLHNRRGFWEFAGASVGLVIAAVASENSQLWALLRQNTGVMRLVDEGILGASYVLLFGVVLWLRWVISEAVEPEAAHRPERRFEALLCAAAGWVMSAILLIGGSIFALNIPK